MYGIIILDLKALSPNTTTLGLGKQDLTFIHNNSLAHSPPKVVVFTCRIVSLPRCTTNIHAGSVLTSVFLTMYIYGKCINRTFSHCCFSTTLDSQ